MAEEQFDDIFTALKGTTVLKTPRVSRETIIEVLETHTKLIKGLKEDHETLSKHVNQVEADTKKNTADIHSLNDETKKIKVDIESLFRLSNEFRAEMDELSAKVADLYLMKKQIGEQKEFIENLSARYNKFSGEVTEFMSDAQRTLTTVQESCNETQFMLKELKDYVDHFADNLILSAKQITVDPELGFGPKAMPLTEVLTVCQETFSTLETGQQEMTEHMAKVDEELEAKAPDSILFNVSTLEKKVATIELHLQKEEEQGIGAIRKTCDELTMHVQSMSTELQEKIDKDSVGFIVHEKYEEIVRYLQDALQSSLEDENKFKQKADEIQEMVILLSNSKADRTEIQNMQELMVKSEALLKKVGSQVNIKDRLKEFMPRKEVESQLATKVSRNEMDIKIQNILANTKRSRKLTSVVENANTEVEDEALKLPQVNVGNKNQIGPEADDPGLVMRSMSASELAIRQAQGNLTTPSGEIPVIALGQTLNSPSRSSGDFGGFVKNKGGKNPVTSASLPSNAAPGAFRTATESGRAGGQGKPQNAANNADGYGRSEYPYVPPNYQMDYEHQSQVTDHMAYLHGPVVGGGFNVHSKSLQHASPGAKPLLEEDVEGKGMMLKGKDGQFYYQDLKPQGGGGGGGGGAVQIAESKTSSF